jgi:hypothetical protein
MSYTTPAARIWVKELQDVSEIPSEERIKYTGTALTVLAYNTVHVDTGTMCSRYMIVT